MTAIAEVKADPRFTARRQELNHLWDVTITFVDKLVGGVPSLNDDPQDKDLNILRFFIKSKVGDRLTEEELEAEVARTAEEVSHEMEAACTQTFKKDEVGVYIEGRQVKALIKEAGCRLGFGKAVKGKAVKGKAVEGGRPSLRQELHEGVHVDEDRIYLTRDGAILQEPDGYETRPISVMGPQGPRTAIKSSAYCQNPTVSFTVRSLRNMATDEDVLVDILSFGQDLGLGADRSQGYGKFIVTEFVAR